MKKYIIIFDQGNGCDFTIGCGILVFEIEANNLDEVKTKLGEKLRNYRSPEYRIEDITILEVNEKISIDPYIFYDMYDMEEDRE